MDQTTNRCRGCSVELPKQKSGNPRKWCSEACRVRAFRRSHPEYVARQAQRAREEAAQRAKAVREDPRRPKCQHCGGHLRSGRNARFCSSSECQQAKRCYDKARAPECGIARCGRPALARGMCGSHYSAWWRKRNPDRAAAGASRYRARKRDAFVENVNHLEVLKRDNWKCGICGQRIPKHAKYPDPRSASVDHVVPLNKGGLHEMKNVQASHLICNALKADRGSGDQLALM